MARGLASYQLPHQKTLMEGNTKSGNAPQSTGHVRVKLLAPIASSLFPVGSSRQGTKKKKTSAWSSRLTLLSRVLLYGSLPSASASLSPSLQQQKRCVVAISSDTPLSLQKANAETRVVRIITVVAVAAKKKEEEGENSSPIASERGEQKSLDVGKAMTEERERRGPSFAAQQLPFLLTFGWKNKRP